MTNCRLILVRCLWSIRALLKRWPIASLLFVIHTLLVLGFYVWWLPSAAKPYSELGWLLMAFVDFPIFLAYLPLVDHASGHVFALVAILFGGANDRCRQDKLATGVTGYAPWESHHYS